VILLNQRWLLLLYGCLSQAFSPRWFSWTNGDYYYYKRQRQRHTEGAEAQLQQLLTSALYRTGSQLHALATLSPLPVDQKRWWPPEPVWTLLWRDNSLSLPRSKPQTVWPVIIVLSHCRYSYVVQNPLQILSTVIPQDKNLRKIWRAVSS
jgi:hypothetical protein